MMSTRVATHEAGHAVAVYIHGARIEYISALPSARGHGEVKWDHAVDCEHCDPLTVAVIALAGPATEARYHGNADDDDVIRRASTVDDDRFRAAIGEMAHSWLEHTALVTWLRVRARELVRTPRFAHLIEALIPVLAEHGQLDGDAATAVLRRADDAYDRGRSFSDEGGFSPASRPRAQDFPEVSGRAVAL